MQHKSIVISVVVSFLIVGTANAQNDTIPISEEDRPFLLHYPSLDDPDGRVVLTNEHVVLQRLYVPAGEWEGLHSHPGNQIYVHIKGGEWSGRLGGESEYDAIASPDGEIGWMDPIPLTEGHESGNTGDTDIDLIYVTLKKDAPVAPEKEHAPQAFPDIQLKLLLDNDRMIVQRAILEPGQWTGAHEHPGNQVFLSIRDGIQSERRGDDSPVTTTELEAGTVGWIDARADDNAHDIGNTGDTTMEIVLVTIK